MENNSNNTVNAEQYASMLKHVQRIMPLSFLNKKIDFRAFIRNEKEVIVESLNKPCNPRREENLRTVLFAQWG